MNPLTGRFWTADTYEGGNSDPVSLHKYLYANADPVNGMDPSGNMTSIGEALSAANLAVTRGVSAIRLGFQVGTKAGGRALWDVGKIVETQIVGRALGVGCGSGVNN